MTGCPGILKSMAKWTKARINMVENYVKYVAEATGLSGWSIRVGIFSGNVGLAGQCESQEAYRTVKISLWPDVIQDEEELTGTIVHEVCHGSLSSIRDSLKTVEALMKKSARTAADAILLEAEERVCTQMSQGLIRSGSIMGFTEWREKNHPRMHSVIRIEESQERLLDNATPAEVTVDLKDVVAHTLFTV